MPRNFKPISFEGTKVVFDNIKLKDGDTDYSKGWNDGIKDSWAVVLEHFGRKN